MIRLLVRFLKGPFNPGPHPEFLILGMAVDRNLEDGEYEGKKVENDKT